MKFTKEHYDILLEKIKELNENLCLGSEKVKYDSAGLSHERFCWDIFFKSGVHVGSPIGMSRFSVIEGDYNDSHILTAIKKAIKEVIG